MGSRKSKDAAETEGGAGEAEETLGGRRTCLERGGRAAETRRGARDASIAFDACCRESQVVREQVVTKIARHAGEYEDQRA